MSELNYIKVNKNNPKYCDYGCPFAKSIRHTDINYCSFFSKKEKTIELNGDDNGFIRCRECKKITAQCKTAPCPASINMSHIVLEILDKGV